MPVAERTEADTGTAREHAPGAVARRWRRLTAAAVAGALLAFGAVLVLSSGPSDQERRAALHSYLDELKPLAEEAGFLIVHGLRAGVSDIGSSRYDDETLQGMPRAWGNMLRTLRGKFEALPPPPGLEQANVHFIASIDGYIEVTEQLSDAAEAPRYRRRMLVRRAANLGEEMDRVWNKGAYVIQWELDALGEHMVIWLPDPTVNPDSDDYVDGDPDPGKVNDFLKDTGVSGRPRDGGEAGDDAQTR